MCVWAEEVSLRSWRIPRELLEIMDVTWTFDRQIYEESHQFINAWSLEEASLLLIYKHIGGKNLVGQRCDFDSQSYKWSKLSGLRVLSSFPICLVFYSFVLKGSKQFHIRRTNFLALCSLMSEYETTEIYTQVLWYYDYYISFLGGVAFPK